MKRNYTRIVIFVLALSAVVAFVILRRAMNRSRSPQETKEGAVELLTKAGGADRLCEEADQMFNRFGESNLQSFENSELKAYPCIAELGGQVGIFPDNPACLQIRVGNHADSYFILIYSTNNVKKHLKAPYEMELYNSRVFVY
jgi:hypothetical protein